MTKRGLGWLILWSGLSLAFPAVSFGDTVGGAPDFKEVYDLLRAQAGGLSEAELNRAAVQGLVNALSPRVRLITNSATGGQGDAPLLSRTSLMEKDMAYLRCDRVRDGLAESIRKTYKGFNETNKVKGIVLDLRYAGGNDYSAAIAVANLFASKGKPLLNWGDGMVSSKASDQPIALPVAVLVNRRTTAAAEALAAAMRLTGVGLILGSRTAGEALMGHEFALKNGDRLCIGAGPIILGDGSVLSAEGVKPDIAVDVDSQDERAYYADAFKLITKTNQVNGAGRPGRRQRFNEAELVRERRDGYNPDSDISNSNDADNEPTVHDPVLARALDLLKGLAVVREARS
jgi:C-terminal processing protease CtpA/Prc